MVAATVSRGSSPLTRGGRATLRTLIASIGLIPAYAGRTPRPLRRGRHAGAHPRLRGADSCLQPHYMPPRGSSPLTRGGQILRDVDNLSAGLIPAYAGRTSVEIPVSRLVGAHPRLRGADPHPGLYDSCGWGSSPLTRGGHREYRQPHAHHGLIPAYAGRTAITSHWQAAPRAHPRLRGAD